MAYICKQCGHKQDDPGVCSKCNVPLEEEQASEAQQPEQQAQEAEQKEE